MSPLPVGVVPCFIKGYDDDYIVWSNGTVVSLKRKQPKKLTPASTGKGYMAVGLYRKGIHRTTKIHRLVAEHFVPNPDNKPQVDHRDVDQENNNMDNLRWVTHAENTQNRGMMSNNTSGAIGINITAFGTFRATINANNKTYTKTFKNKPDAIAWYAEMKADLHIR